MEYRCANCNRAVVVLPGCDPIKACKCDSAITANMSASTYGTGAMQKIKEYFEEVRYEETIKDIDVI
jgi:hypothetical protein